MKKILLIAVPLILIVSIAVGVGIYRADLEVQKFPSSSIKTIREAVAARNAAAVRKLVDTDAIIDTAAAEILTAQINDTTNSMTYSALDLQNLYDARKAEFVAAANAALKDYLATGRVNFPDNPNDAERWLMDSRVETCVINAYSKPVSGEGIARTKVEFYDAALMFSFELEIVMERIGENTWRVVSATGFDKFYNGVKRGLQARLESLNAPIRAEISDVFDLKGFDAAVVEGDEYGFSKTLRLTVEANVFEDKPIEKIGGRVVIDGEDGKESATPFEIYVDEAAEDGVQSFTIDKILNPFVRTDANVMRHGLKKKAIHIDVTEIIFSDGTSIRQFDELPD